MSNKHDKTLAYWVSLNNAPGIGPTRFKLLLNYFKSPQLVWKADYEVLTKLLGEKIYSQFNQYRKRTDPERYLSDIINQKISVITLNDKSYPKLLAEIYDKPPVLFFKGEIKPEDNLALAVVGTRKVTTYGREVTAFLVRKLVENNLTVISGLARGVDSLAHRTALEYEGRTIAVLGSGLNKIYPPENYRLAEEIAKNGALISEFPPDLDPSPGNFPARNRIISGLSLGVLVTEAGEESGSLITANCAIEQNREVFAVPGAIFNKLSKGPADLIKMGAKLVYDANDIFEELNLESKARFLKVASSVSEDPAEALILKLLTNEAKTIDQLVRESGLQTNVVCSVLTLMEIKGKVKNLGNMLYTIFR